MLRTNQYVPSPSSFLTDSTNLRKLLPFAILSSAFNIGIAIEVLNALHACSSITERTANETVSLYAAPILHLGIMVCEHGNLSGEWVEV